MLDTAAADNSSTLSHTHTHTFFNGLLPTEDWWRFRLCRRRKKREWRSKMETRGGEMKSRERKEWGERSIRGCRDEEMHLKSTWFYWSKSFLMFVLSSDCCERNAAAFEVRAGSERLTDTLSSKNDVKTWRKQKKMKDTKTCSETWEMWGGNLCAQHVLQEWSRRWQPQ